MKGRVQFPCTGNSARSVPAEATLRARAGDRFRALSAGSRPTSAISPFALARLAAEGISSAGLRSKSRDASRLAHRLIKARLEAFLVLPAQVWDERQALQPALDRSGQPGS